jgi:NADH-quinone oxidoreductase subunit M
VQVSPLVGIAIVVAAALNGLAVLHAYFRIFTGSRHLASIDLGIRVPERVAVLVLSALLVGGGLYPQPGVAGRYNAAAQLVQERDRRLGDQIPSAESPRDALRVASSAQQNPSGAADH